MYYGKKQAKEDICILKGKLRDDRSKCYTRLLNDAEAHITNETCLICKLPRIFHDERGHLTWGCKQK